jgi:hypothetical protein
MAFYRREGGHWSGHAWRLPRSPTSIIGFQPPGIPAYGVHMLRIQKDVLCSCARRAPPAITTVAALLRERANGGQYGVGTD